jgi:hypothetical protein
VAEAAERGGVGERTVYRRLKDAEFRRAVSETRSRAFDAAVGKLAGLAAQAVSTLERILQQGSRCEALRAAKTILELGPRLRTFTELEERVTALESEEPKPRGDDGQQSGETDGESGETDFPAKVRRGMGRAPGRLTARLERLERQRAKRDGLHGGSVAEEVDEVLQETGTEPPSTEVAENGRQCEVRWR